ncbi:hypothetical protein MtrunA17_Chr6g0475781 [Medicago truncatula]|uniref:Uncharacterized protein n=1 Tax=Medicago truncatula TaxID=3880 RepID=A0A396HFJ1_MEDTR|nr:hypothetical protein MtrunA17_Chr6g0475781 [Medicago truncatula]
MSTKTPNVGYGMRKFFFEKTIHLNSFLLKPMIIYRHPAKLDFIIGYNMKI